MITRIFIVFIAFCVSACALEQASPSDYNDAIFREQMKVKDLITILTKTSDFERQKEIVDELKTQTNESLKRIKEIGSFRGDEQLHKAAIELFEFYQRMAHEGLDVEKTLISSKLDQWRPELSEQEHVFFKAQGKFAENYELFL
jgi:hypothetical protein